MTAAAPLLQADELSVGFPVRRGILPAMSVETITVVLDLGNTGGQASSLREAA